MGQVTNHTIYIGMCRSFGLDLRTWSEGPGPAGPVLRYFGPVRTWSYRTRSQLSPDLVLTNDGPISNPKKSDPILHKRRCYQMVMGSYLIGNFIFLLSSNGGFGNGRFFFY